MTIMRNLTQILLVPLVFACLVIPRLGWAIDLQPNDIVAPLADKNIITLSHYETENTNLYKNGTLVNKTPYGNPKLHSHFDIVRVATSFTVADRPALSYIQVPIGSLQPEGSLSSQSASTGVGDVTLAAAIWPYANRESGRYLGLAAFLVLPTGPYSSTQSFNLGAKQHSLDVQIGFQTPIVGHLDGMIAIDSMHYGGNNQCAAACLSPTQVSLSQNALTTTQLGPIYKINEMFTVGVSYFYVVGGATEINHVYQNNAVQTQRFLLSAQASTDWGRLSLQYGRDIDVKNGFIQPRVLAVRLARNF